MYEKLIEAISAVVNTEDGAIQAEAIKKAFADADEINTLEEFCCWFDD